MLLQSKAPEQDEDTETDVDSGYQTFDPAEADDDEQDSATKTGEKMTRPPGVSDRDWQVVEVFDEVVNEFSEKFRAMFSFSNMIESALNEIIIDYENSTTFMSLLEVHYTLHYYTTTPLNTHQYTHLHYINISFKQHNTLLYTLCNK